MATQDEILRRMRYRLLGMMHAGQLRAGDRLPSIRQLARDTDTDHRAVARAYRSLQEEGLVEIRRDSGVYAAPVPGTTEEPEGEAGWIAEVLAEGWRRGVGRERIGALLARCAAVRPVCALVESNEDHTVALTLELEDLFSLQVRPVPVEPDAAARAVEGALPADAGLVVSTAFHARAAAGAAAARAVPFVQLTLGADFIAGIARRLQSGNVTAVVADLRFAERGMAYFAVTAHRTRIHYVLADRVEREGIDLEAPDVLVTRAARRRLGLPEHHLLPGQRLISPESARSLLGAIVRLALAEA